MCEPGVGEGWFIGYPLLDDGRYLYQQSAYPAGRDESRLMDENSLLNCIKFHL
jgi:hypothetical protein